MDDRTLMEKVHQLFPESGAKHEIEKAVNSLEKTVSSLSDQIKKMRKIVDGQMKGKTRDAFIERIDYLEKKRKQIEDKMADLRRSVN
ncbi:hypothetical protein P9232_11590 [Weizmannia sp. CD-2023]|uniref:hypothetical protein n=1 Tax=Heyndrickxia TaxID=2837504 RepID=UPI000558B0EA|nr:MULTISPECIES: hypothetical protein [Heyndrickxia]KGT38483.1 hypothetical protein P421_09735 [Heyndrickxia coagulans P38]MED4322092.1 hypothetical protein [Weizmannia sp. CD-2023]